MQTQVISLLELLGASKRTFNIPVYQRNYAWNKGQCKQLFDDICNIIENNYDIKHFVGTVVFIKDPLHLQDLSSDFVQFLLIDGQQRITSIILLLKAIHKNIQDEDTKEDIKEHYFINKKAKSLYRIKLKPVASDRDTFEACIDDEPMHNDSKIAINYNYFIELLRNTSHDYKSILKAIRLLEIVEISLDRDKKHENPQLIFESLNSTGLSLTQADLVRNLLLMRHSYEIQERLYADYWIKFEKSIGSSTLSDYFRDYITLKTKKIPNKDAVYSACKTYLNSQGITEKQILADLYYFSPYYTWLLSCDSQSEELNIRLKQIHTLRSTVTYPVLLYVLSRYFEEKLPEVIRFLDIFISYLYRRLVCDYPTNALNKVFCSLISVFEGSDSIYDTFIDFMRRQVQRQAFPKTLEFRNAFISKDMYNSKLKEYTLFTLESHDNGIKIVDDNINVEHILPQKLNPLWEKALGENAYIEHAKYLHTIGNLTLTAEEYNSSMGNDIYARKKHFLEKSHLALNKNLPHEWNIQAIKDRANALADIATQIWASDDRLESTYDEELQKNKTSFILSDEAGVTSTTPKLLIFGELEKELKINSTWKDFLIKLCEVLYEHDQEKFVLMIQDNDFKRKGVFRKSIDDSRNHYLPDGIIVNHSHSALDALKHARSIARHFDMEDDIYYEIEA